MGSNICDRGVALCENMECLPTSAFVCACDQFFYPDESGICTNNFAIKFFWYWFFFVILQTISFSLLLILDLGILARLVLSLKSHVFRASLRNLVATLLLLTCVFRIAFPILDPYGVWLGGYWRVSTFMSELISGVGTCFFLLTFISLVAFWARLCHSWFNRLTTRLFGKLLPVFLVLSFMIFVVELLRSLTQVYGASLLSDIFVLSEPKYRLEQYVEPVYHFYMFVVTSCISFFMVLFGVKVLSFFRRKYGVGGLMEDGSDTVREDTTVMEDDEIDSFIEGDQPVLYQKRGLLPTLVRTVKMLRPRLLRARSPEERQARDITLLVVTTGTLFSFISILFLFRTLVDLVGLLIPNFDIAGYFIQIFLEFVGRMLEVMAILALMVLMFRRTTRTTSVHGKEDTEIEDYVEDFGSDTSLELEDGLPYLEDPSKQNDTEVEDSDYEASDGDDDGMSRLANIEKDIRASIHDFKDLLEGNDYDGTDVESVESSLDEDKDLQREHSINNRIDLQQLSRVENDLYAGGQSLEKYARSGATTESDSVGISRDSSYQKDLSSSVSGSAGFNLDSQMMDEISTSLNDLAKWSVRDIQNSDTDEGGDSSDGLEQMAGEDDALEDDDEVLSLIASDEEITPVASEGEADFAGSERLGALQWQKEDMLREIDLGEKSDGQASSGYSSARSKQSDAGDARFGLLEKEKQEETESEASYSSAELSSVESLDDLGKQLEALSKSTLFSKQMLGLDSSEDEVVSDDDISEGVLSDGVLSEGVLSDGILSDTGSFKFNLDPEHDEVEPVSHIERFIDSSDESIELDEPSSGSEISEFGFEFDL